MAGVGERPRRPVDRRWTDVWSLPRDAGRTRVWDRLQSSGRSAFRSTPATGVASSLLDILETGEPPQRYYLSATACRGILRRAEKRGKELPEALKSALQAVASQTLPPPSIPAAKMASSAIN